FDDRAAIFLLRNEGVGAFSELGSFQVQSFRSLIDFGDLDGDGSPDFVEATYFSPSIVVKKNDGMGSFGVSQTVLPLENGLDGFALADIEGNGNVDIVGTMFGLC